MTHFKTGTATINHKMEIVRADQNFYQFIGWENPIYLEQSVYREDFQKLKEALEKTNSTGESVMCSYRVRREDESLHWVVANISKQVVEGQGDLLNLNLQAVDDLEQELSSLNDEIHELSTYIDIMDELFFRYDVETDDFCIFMGGERQRVKLFKGSLESWEKSLLQGGKMITDKYVEIFEDFCDDLRKGTRHFSYEIMMQNLVRGDSKELYLFKGRTIPDSRNELSVLGCIYTITKNSHRRKSRTAADEDRDEMTGLLSKQTITDYIKNAIKAGGNGTHYLCIMDIDNFKNVNDTYGHMFGDEVLITVADILREGVGDRGVAGRIGGDEMIFFLENIADRVDLKSILRTIRSNVEWAYKGVRDDLNLSCSIGVAAFPLDAKSYDDLFKIADKMLYLAKEKGKNRYIIYTEDIHGHLVHDDGTASSAEGNRRKMLGADKTHLVLEFSENFLHSGLWNIQFVLEQTGLAFGLEETAVFYDEPIYTPVYWRSDGGALSDLNLSSMDSTKLRQLFDENHLAVIHHTYDLEFACPEAHERLKANNITAAIIYRMNGKVPGYVFFSKTESVSRNWAESDKAYLNIIGKMIELVLCGR